MEYRRKIKSYQKIILLTVASLGILLISLIINRRMFLPRERHADQETAIVHRTFHFIEHFNEGVQRTTERDRGMISVVSASVAGERRRSLFLHPNSSIEFKNIKINPGATLEFCIGVEQKMWEKSSDGILFQVLVKHGVRTNEVIFEKHIDPKNNPQDRKWFDASVSLKAFENQVVSVIFSTRAGPRNDTSGDWAVWSGLKLVSEGKKIRVRERIGNDKPNIVLITIDTLRADFLGCYGKDDISTPVIDSLAREGVLFECALAQSGTTNPSHSSIMSSLYLKDHQVYGNKDALSESVFTLAEYLSAKGYQTAAIVSAEHLNHEHSGLGQGFQYFFPCQGGYRQADSTTSTISWWIEENYDKPFLVWIHYYDPHMPYTPPPPYDTLYYDGDPRNHEKDTMQGVQLPPLSADKLEWLKDVRDIYFPISQYMGEISYVDQSIGSILEMLKNLRIRDDTVLILTADHGESMKEHGVWFGHYGLFETIIRIPLIIRVPELKHGPKRIANLVESVDIFPTILDILKMPLPERIRGISLVPLILGETDTHKEHAYSEMANGLQRSVRSKEYKLIESLSNGYNSYQYKFRKGDVELYRMRADTDELENLATPDSKLVVELKENLKNWSGSRLAIPDTEKKEVSPELQEHLRALGYLD